MQKHLKGSAVLIVIIVILAIIIVAASGLVGYFWWKSKGIATPTATSTPISTPDQTPTKVVESFMNATLGTLPGAKVNYDLARTYMTDSLKIKHSGEAWVPLFYGIQDGPNSVKFISQTVVGDSVYVRFDPSWGEISLGWMFTLKKINGQWLIDDFKNDVQ